MGTPFLISMSAQQEVMRSDISYAFAQQICCPYKVSPEGNALHHCVGSYANRVAKKECVILFLRRTEELEKPFYTVEVRNRKVVQVQGMGHCDPTPEVEAFMAQWGRQVLRAA